MELLSNAPAHHSVPDKYVFPPDNDECAALLADDYSPDVAFPVIDLGGSDLPIISNGRRRQLASEIIRAGKEFGFFQVVNHGVGEGVVRRFRGAMEEFFAMPAEEKLPYCSYDRSKRFRLATGTTYDRGETSYWRDYIKFRCYPASEENARHWPSKPSNFTPSLMEYCAAVDELAQTILRLIAEGLGLDGSFFAGDLSGGDTHMSVNYYPPCPDPTVTMGLLAHCDRNLLTVLSQADVAGLQARHDGRWLLVRPIPGAFVVNFGHQMEIVTNGVLASVKHRAITNSTTTRMSVATHVHPTDGCRIRPASEMVDDATNPVKYREFLFKEFLEAYDAADANSDQVLKSFKIHHD
ncbi:2'-deoxymugineic-acid 2'-dioxygenase [Hordeum vulgare]|nr:2'-deoxymugineic-acid 2'-dioxygenase [Hordeum vulgare]